VQMRGEGRGEGLSTGVSALLDVIKLLYVCEAGIFLKDAVLVGARMGFEVVCLASGLILLPFFTFAGFVAILAGLASLVLRLKALMPPTRKLKAEGGSFALAKIFVFAYLNKWHWIRGVISGQLAGANKCREARGRIDAMTPELYRERIGKFKSRFHSYL